MFHDHLVSFPNQTSTEMMCRSGIVVERHLCSIHRPIEGLMRSGKDWTLMLQAYLIVLGQLIPNGLCHDVLDQLITIGQQQVYVAMTENDLKALPHEQPDSCLVGRSVRCSSKASHVSLQNDLTAVTTSTPNSCDYLCAYHIHGHQLQI